MGKWGWLAAGGVGYVLGSRAGREPYEKLTAKAEELRQNPRVQRSMSTAKQSAKRAADEAAGTAADAMRADSAGRSGTSATGDSTSPDTEFDPTAGPRGPLP